MIKKFKEIGNLAVFQNFEWDNIVLDKANNILEFKQINILYGRNYSGKTTLSRILRATETGQISDKFENPAFCITFSDNTEIKQDNLTGHTKKIRVFNDDFVRDNLKFIINPDESIEPFAILGIDNLRIEGEIRAIESEIGIKDEGKETGLYAKLNIENAKYSIALNNHTNKKVDLDAKLSAKATDRTVGIKYKAEKFGDQNYSKPKLLADINTVLEVGFKPITKDEQSGLEKLLTETTNSPISNLQITHLNLTRFISEVKTLVEKKIGESDKIEELVKDAVLNKWVKEGRLLHKGKRDKCAFCDSDIDVSRWSLLEKHFDEESDKLETDIDKLIKEIAIEINSVSQDFNPNKNLFYSKFHSKIDRIVNTHLLISEKYNEQLESLKKQLQERKDDLINRKTFNLVSNFSKRLRWIFDIYENLRVASNDYSNSLASDQTNAKTSLRLREVFDFVKDINYSTEIIAIQELKNKEDDAKIECDKVSNEIVEKSELIDSKRRELKDESKGADKVNEYLNNFFGHDFLSLRAVEFETEEETPVKKFRFDVIRDRKKAYHLSEGECSLVAFCYFMAKLDDVETKGAKPIIWIDDPISSLDSNHIFFVYSLMNTEIVGKEIFEQLFISTHNLDFLKYLKRLPGAHNDIRKKEENKKYQYFIIQRIDKISVIKVMPDYLRDYVTEFNYLFHQVYLCSSIDTIDDSNYTLFYNFGNNARKFLEIFLYYKFPDDSSDADKMIKFFGDEAIPAILTDRINNEYSHLSGIFERGSTPVEVPEMKTTARLIIDKLKEDSSQYESLLKSIGVEITIAA